MPKVLFFAPPSGPAVDSIIELTPDGWELVRVDPRETGADGQAELVADADFLVVSGGRVTADVLRAGKKLRLAQLMSAGFDGFPVAEAGELGIPVANASGTNSQGVAEFALTLMLACYRHLPWLDRSTRSGEWMIDRALGHDTYEILDKTIGIVGLGHIGAITARILQGFSPTILYSDVVARPDLEEELGVQRVELDELLERSDIVTLHTPLNRSTRALIGERELSLMKPSAILINTCRGPVIDEAALYEALRERRIWGAGLDVFEQEPTPDDNPLLQLDNVVVAPHVAGKTAESYPRRAKFAFENMQRVLAGEPPLNVVLPD